MFEFTVGSLLVLFYVLMLLWRRRLSEYSAMLQIKLPDKEEDLATDTSFLLVTTALKRYRTAIALGDNELVEAARKARNCIYWMTWCTTTLFGLVWLKILGLLSTNISLLIAFVIACLAATYTFKVSLRVKPKKQING